MNAPIPEPTNVLFIKMGVAGEFERTSIADGKVKLDYREIDHVKCLEGKWDEVYDQISREYKTQKRVTTSHCNQVKMFYTEPVTTLWITYFDNKLWYCFAETEIHLNDDYTKYRKAIGGWKDVDINDRKLEMQSLSGRLTKVQGYRGTICSVEERSYLIRVINDQQDQTVIELERHQQELINDIEKLLVRIQWKDFEVLVDLLFRASGWARIGNMGGTIKDIDLKLINPISDEYAFAQVKSKCDKATYFRFRDMASVSHETDFKFFIVHSPAPDLIEYMSGSGPIDDGITIIAKHKLAKRCLNSGLVDWLVAVVG